MPRSRRRRSRCTGSSSANPRAFRKLAAAVTSEGATQEAIALIGGVLSREARAGRLTLDDPMVAAEQFLHMVLSVPQRRALGLGKPMTPAELERWAARVVDLFLNGCRAHLAETATTADIDYSNMPALLPDTKQ